MLPQISKLKRIALDLLFPQWCVGCGREGNYVCINCRQSLSLITPPICSRCGRPESRGSLCSGCTDWEAEIDGIRSPFVFDGVMRKAIHELKYRNLRAMAIPLAQWLRDYLISHPLPGEVLVPVPLHPKRLKERGYNQSGLLARELSQLTRLPVVDNCLIRRQHTPPQARTTTAKERQSNVRSAFTCRDEGLRDRQILLIDDVATSGATLDACATALKTAGAATVWGLVMALDI